MKYIKLSEYAKIYSITYRTAWQYFKDGKINGAINSINGTILIPIEEKEEIKTIINKPNVVIYSRVSSSENKDNLISQSHRLMEFGIKNNYNIVEIIKEIGSGVNDNRPKLNKILKQNNWDILLIEHKDRLTRFGFNYIENLLENQNKKIVVVNHSEELIHDLMEDLISIIYSFSARLYGLRRSKNKIKNIVNILKEK
jgi:putative resolvase